MFDIEPFDFEAQCVVNHKVVFMDEDFGLPDGVVARVKEFEFLHTQNVAQYSHRLVWCSQLWLEYLGDDDALQGQVLGVHFNQVNDLERCLNVLDSHLKIKDCVAYVIEGSSNFDEENIVEGLSPLEPGGLIEEIEKFTPVKIFEAINVPDMAYVGFDVLAGKVGKIEEEGYMEWITACPDDPKLYRDVLSAGKLEKGSLKNVNRFDGLGWVEVFLVEEKTV